MNEQVEVIHGERSFVVDVGFSAYKRLTLTVYPDLKIAAKAPHECCREELHRRLEKRAAWIARQVDYFEQFQPQPAERKYVSGETHYYLGRQYRLRIMFGNEPKVRLIGRFFEMELPEPEDQTLAKQLLLDWYDAHAREVLSKRLDFHLPPFLNLGARRPRVSFRQMAKRWGSCSEKGAITLNLALAKVPADCIDYVIVHELCHLVCARHDRRFFQLLGKILPDWERRKMRLERSVL